MSAADARAGPVGSAAATGAEAVLDAALGAFHELGYGGTPVREIARRAGLTVAGLYYHFASKHDMLATLMHRTMERIIADAEERLRAVPCDDPVGQLRAVVDAHVRFHTTHQAEAFVANAELRSLDRAAYDEVVALRDRYEATLHRIIRDGVARGVFGVRHSRQAARATLAMCTSVATWFRVDGPLPAEEVAEQYVELVLSLVDHHGPG